MRLLILLIFIASITSCTVQKRVHRKGWHIEWNRSAQKVDSKTEEQSNVHHAEQMETDANKNQKKSVRRTTDVTLLKREKPSEKTVASIHSSKVPTTFSRPASNHKSLVRARHNEKFDFKKEEPDETKTDGSPIASIIMIIAATILSVGTILLILNFATLEPAVLATTGIVVLGLASLLFFTLGIFNLIRRATEKKHPEKKAERLAKLEAKRNDPDYNPDRLNIIIGIISGVIVTGLFLWLTRFQ